MWFQSNKRFLFDCVKKTCTAINCGPRDIQQDVQGGGGGEIPVRLCIFTIGLLPSAYRLLLQPQQCASAINIRPLAAAILVSSDLILLAREKISALRATV